MLRNVPVDAERVALLGSGSIEPVVDWIDDPTTGRRKPADQQTRDEETQAPLWRVHCLVPGGEDGRPELVSVQVPAHERPQVPEFGPVAFERLSVRVAVGRDGKLAGYWSAAGVRPAAHHAHGNGRGKAQQGHQEGEG